jgi:hypothetical protein
MSDYEDIWCDPAAASIRSITPAESENQFKAYLAQKLQGGGDTHLDMVSPCLNNNNNFEKSHLSNNNNNNNNTVSSSISSTSSNLSGQSVTSSKISVSLESSKRSSSISSPVVSRNEIGTKLDIGTDSLSSSSASSQKQGCFAEFPTLLLETTRKLIGYDAL